MTYKGYRTAFIENDLIRVGILLDKGGDFFQFIHKPSDTDFLWRSPQGLMRPDRFTTTRASTAGSFLDTYHGGWQEILPGGGPADYQGAELGLHGEVTLLGWDFDILEDREDCLVVRLSVNCIRTPLRIEKTLRMQRGLPVLFVEETLTNTSPQDIEFAWGHHPAFGAPFLQAGCRLFIPSGQAEVHQPKFAASGIFRPGSTFDWPHAISESGQAIDLSCIPGAEAGYADLLYLNNLSAGWYAVLNPVTQVGFGLSWPVETFPFLWFWLVYGKAPGFPWWDRVYCIALEPWTSIPNALPQAQEAGRLFHLKGGEQHSVTLCATAITGREEVRSITQDGSVL